MRRLTKKEIFESAARREGTPGEVFLRDFCSTVEEKGQAPSEEALRKVVEGLRLGLKGVAFNKAFGLRVNGRRPQILTARQADRLSEAAARVKFRMLTYGEKKTRAAEMLCAELDMTVSAILKAYANYPNDNVAQYMFALLKKHAARQRSTH